MTRDVHLGNNFLCFFMVLCPFIFCPSCESKGSGSFGENKEAMIGIEHMQASGWLQIFLLTCMSGGYRVFCQCFALNYYFIFGCVVSCCCAGFFCCSGKLKVFSCYWYLGFSLWWLLLFGAPALGRAAFSSCGSRALEQRFSSCGAQAQLLWGVWNLPGPGFEPMTPALAG